MAITASLEGLFGLAKLPAPLAYPLLVAIGLLLQSVGLTCQGLRWIARGGRRYGQGDSRVLRTPEDRFAKLDAYPFKPNYFIDTAGLRIHYIDEGPQDAKEVVVLIHGMPAWSYCYRKVIPKLVAEGHRVIALDFCGMGKSDKPVDASKLSFAAHVASISALVAHVRISSPRITLVIHDWGGLIGQTALPTLDGVLKRLVILNTFAGPSLMGLRGTLLFVVWQGLSRTLGRGLPVAEINAADAGGPSKITLAAEAGYGAPFPSADYKALVAIWPLMYNNRSSVLKQYNSSLAWAQAHLNVPVLVAYGKEDLILDLDRAHGFFKSWMKRSPSIERVEIPNAAHFPMESNPEAVADSIVNFMRNSQ